MKKRISSKNLILSLCLIMVWLVAPVTVSASTFPGLNGRLLYTNTNSYTNYQMVTVKSDGTGSTAIGANDLARRYASFSPDGTKIVYTSGGAWQYTWIANADGSNAVQLTSGSTNSIYPSFSPDGTKILYSYAVSSIYQLWTMNLNGTGATMLYSDSGHIYKASYSPDGTKIVFSSTFGGGDNEVGIVNADGTGAVNLTNNSQHDDDPSFSPDGTKIVYNSLALSGGAEYQIHTMNLNGSGDVQLTSDAVYHGSPVYSPDGTKIAYRQGGTPIEVYYINADGSGATRVTTNGWADSKLDWQPLTIAPSSSNPNPTVTSNGGSVTVNIPSLYTDNYGGIDAASVSVIGTSSNMSASVNSTTGVITITPNFATAQAKPSFWGRLVAIFFPKVSAAGSGTVTYRVCSQANSNLCSSGTITVSQSSTASSLADTGDNPQILNALAFGLIIVGASLLTKIWRVKTR